MRHVPRAVAVLLLLVGCGDEEGDLEVDPAPPDVVLVSGTAAGGESAETWTVLPDDAALAAYVKQFRGRLPGDVSGAADRVDVDVDEMLVAQVVAIGCDVPPGARLGDGRLVAEKVASPLRECLAPITTVALAAIPDAG